MLTNFHRKFFVNNKLEFALFFDAKIKDKDKIIQDFLESKDWKWHLNYFNVTVTKTTISKDLMEIYITTKDTK